MYYLTDAIVNLCALESGFKSGNQDMLQILTKPLTEKLIQVPPYFHWNGIVERVIFLSDLRFVAIIIIC